jgi:hypothetical protein
MRLAPPFVCREKAKPAGLAFPRHRHYLTASLILTLAGSAHHVGANTPYFLAP